mgnify:CR=1 FL=1|jgi:hypothetical protein
MIAAKFLEAYAKGRKDCKEGYEKKLDDPNPYPKPDINSGDTEYHAYNYGWNSVLLDGEDE